MARARAVIIQDGAVALIERRRDGRLYYVFPGGGVEGDETPRQAAVREAREELGLVVAPGPLIAEVVRDGETQFLYLASVTGGAFGSGDGPEMTGAAPARGTYTPIWVSLAELRRLPVYPAAVAGIVAAAAERGWPGVTGRSRAVPTLKRKAFAYITHGDRLLVFRHPAAPDAGIQVPAGSMRTGERPEDAVLREAREETGLADLVLVGALGEHRRDMADVGLDEMHHSTSSTSGAWVIPRRRGGTGRAIPRTGVRHQSCSSSSGRACRTASRSSLRTMTSSSPNWSSGCWPKG